jgi:hypothetical protein
MASSTTPVLIKIAMCNRLYRIGTVPSLVLTGDRHSLSQTCSEFLISIIDVIEITDN